MQCNAMQRCIQRTAILLLLDDNNLLTEGALHFHLFYFHSYVPYHNL